MNTATIILTLALVLITAYYAWQTRLTVQVMREQQKGAVRPLVLLAWRDETWRAVNVGAGAAVNGRFQTSGVGASDKASSAQLQPLGPGDVDNHRVYFGPAAHAQLTYQDLAGHKYWSQYCPEREAHWQIGEGESAPGDFGCKCKLDEKGHVAK